MSRRDLDLWRKTIEKDKMMKIKKNPISSRNIWFLDLFATNTYGLAEMSGDWLVTDVISHC